MTKFDDIRFVYFLGIGGIGMSALARFYMARGVSVSGYDKTRTALTDELESEGMKISYDEAAEKLPDFILDSKNNKNSILIIYTPAIPSDHAGKNWLISQGFKLYKRSEVLGLIASKYYTVAVAGTHGKTTTSSMIAHMLVHAGKRCTAFLGGILKNYNSNFLDNTKGEGSHILVAEADEYDRSFLTLFPDVSIITSMDPDHLDIYEDAKFMEESYRLFASQLKDKGKLIYKKGLPLSNTSAKSSAYSLKTDADCYPSDVRIERGRYYFDWNEGDVRLKDLSSGLPGLHNVENAVAAIAACRHLGLTEEEIRSGITSYSGVKRRFERILDTDRFTYIDDYAHHPEELRASISSAREMYPGKHITGIFQPHLYSRTRDFADGFAKSLSLLDSLILMDIYPAREKPIPGVTSELIFNKVPLENKILVSKDNLIGELNTEGIEVLLTLGAGDIDLFVEPIRDLLLLSKQQKHE
ncbi:MAG: UDP-N-acetylmuramate--L-alanine ligase [Bacteroidetes bacterium]|nr:MAG: UDP-N-acetylmuramate--L-alanine ligase [Bacteroidota bacterium]